MKTHLLLFFKKLLKLRNAITYIFKGKSAFKIRPFYKYQIRKHSLMPKFRDSSVTFIVRPTIGEYNRGINTLFYNILLPEGSSIDKAKKLIDDIYLFNNKCQDDLNFAYKKVEEVLVIMKHQYCPILKPDTMMKFLMLYYDLVFLMAGFIKIREWTHIENSYLFIIYVITYISVTRGTVKGYHLIYWLIANFCELVLFPLIKMRSREMENFTTDMDMLIDYAKQKFSNENFHELERDKVAEIDIAKSGDILKLFLVIYYGLLEPFTGRLIHLGSHNRIHRYFMAILMGINPKAQAEDNGKIHTYEYYLLERPDQQMKFIKDNPDKYIDRVIKYLENYRDILKNTKR